VESSIRMNVSISIGGNGPLGRSVMSMKYTGALALASIAKNGGLVGTAQLSKCSIKSAKFQLQKCPEATQATIFVQ
jgi:hypothetical protein